MNRVLSLIAVVALVLGACASDDGSSEAAPPASLPANDAETSTPSDAPIPVEPNEGIGDGAEPLDVQVISPALADEIEGATADLAERIGDDRVVEVVAAHELTWPDGSLGCPQPDMSYTQALVDGYRIEFADGTYRFIYHGALGSEPFLCSEGEEGSRELTPGPVAPQTSSTLPPIEVLPSDPGKDDEPTEQFGGPGGPPDE